MRFNLRLSSLLVGLLVIVACQRFTPDDLAFTIQQARQSGSPIPLVTEIVPRLTVDEAYYIQNAWLEKNLLEDALYGFKAGITSSSAQEKFGLSEPVGGLLLESSKRSPGDTLYLQSMLKPMLEVELGFLINDYISEPITNLDSLRNKVDSVYLMVEIPDLSFEDIRPFNAADLIAANVAAAFYIADTVGYLPNSLDWNNEVFSMQRDGQEIIRGKGSDALGNQWEALKWLLNNYVKRGYVVGKGQVLITGALGAMVEAKAGKHEVFIGQNKSFQFYLK